MDESHIKKIIEKQKDFFATGITKKLSFRKTQLKKLYNVILSNEEHIKNSLFKDFRKPSFETFISEIGVVLHEMRYLIKNIDRLSRPQKVKTPLFAFPGKSYICYEPYGIVLIISPWNYPFQLSISPLVGALAAGNCCILKTSPYLANTSGVIKKIVKETFLEEYVTVIEGHRDINELLLKQKYDFIFFTGSPEFGKVVMESAAKNLTPVVLELGGKSPCVVCEDANLKLAARRLLWSKMINAGQTCVAPDYLLINSKVKDEFIKILLSEYENFYGKRKKDIAHIISDDKYKKLQSYLKDGKYINDVKLDEDDLFLPLVLLDNVKEDAPVMKNEIFGPVLPFIGFDMDEQAIKFILKKEKPLAFYLFTSSKKRMKYYLASISSGGVCINDTVMHVANHNLPFGGVGYSGMGKYHGHWSFETFSNKKAIYQNSLLFDIKLRYPPYTKFKERIARWFF